MSPILDLQRRLREIGRIRTGERAGNRPTKLDRFRLTSPSRDMIEAAAEQYGSDKRGVRAWTNPFDKGQEYEVVVSSETLKILVPPGQSLSQFWELWSGGGCERRCDGRRELIGERPCVCPPVGKERAEQSAKGKACKPTTRLNVILPELPSVGVWRLESHGFNAALELAGTAELLERATRAGRLIPAYLRLDGRTVKRPGEATRNFSVPVIDLTPEAAALVLSTDAAGAPAQLEGGTVAQLPGGPPELPNEPLAVTTASTEQPEQGQGAPPASPARAQTRESEASVPTGRAVPEEEAGSSRSVRASSGGSPSCDHPAAKHETTDDGVVCGECGEVIARRPDAPIAPRGSSADRWRRKAHAVASERGLDADALKRIAADVCGFEGDWSRRDMVDADWEQVVAYVEGIEPDADDEQLQQAAAGWAVAAGIVPKVESDTEWEILDRKASELMGVPADDLGRAEWTELAVRWHGLASRAVVA